MGSLRVSLSRLLRPSCTISTSSVVVAETGFKQQYRHQLMGSLSWRGVIGGFEQRQGLHSHHSGGYSNPTCARFKMKLETRDEKKSVTVVGEEEANEKEEEEEEGKGSYLRNHPYRQLEHLWKSKSDLAKTLIDNTIHNGHGLFVTNKPFGVGVRQPLPIHMQRKRTEDGLSLHLRGVQTSPYTLEEAVPELRHLLGKPNLVLVRSTEKLTSGIAVFADDQAIGEKFSKCVATSKVHFDTLYKYHVVTVMPPFLLPKDPSTVLRFGMTLKKCVGTDINQPMLLRQYSINSVKRREVAPVHCKANILAMGTGIQTGYLVEINTSSVTNNFLRIFCADQLAPILGDHLYSSRVRIMKGVPIKIDSTHLTPGSGFQKLSEGMRESLQLKKEEDSLMVPTHVHLRSYKVRKFIGDKDSVIELEAPYPPYFKWTCEQLGILLEPDSIPIN